MGQLLTLAGQQSDNTGFVLREQAEMKTQLAGLQADQVEMRTQVAGVDRKLDLILTHLSNLDK
jgi:hypothetical protein